MYNQLHVYPFGSAKVKDKSANLADEVSSPGG